MRTEGAKGRWLTLRVLSGNTGRGPWHGFLKDGRWSQPSLGDWETSIEPPSLHTQEGDAGPRSGVRSGGQRPLGKWSLMGGLSAGTSIRQKCFGGLGPQEAWERLTPDSADLSGRE